MFVFPRCPPQLNVATEEGHCVIFQKVLLCHCQSQFEKIHNEEEMINIQEELDATRNVSVTVTDVRESRPLVPDGSIDFKCDGSRVVIHPRRRPTVSSSS